MPRPFLLYPLTDCFLKLVLNIKDIEEMCIRHGSLMLSQGQGYSSKSSPYLLNPLEDFYETWLSSQKLLTDGTSRSHWFKVMVTLKGQKFDSSYLLTHGLRRSCSRSSG